MDYLRDLIEKCSQDELDELKLREITLRSQQLCPIFEEEYLKKYPNKSKNDAIKYADKKFRKLYKNDFQELFRNKIKKLSNN